MRLASRRARLDGSTRSHGSIASDETARLTTTRAFAGALGGLFGTLALYPIDTVKTRIQAESAARGTKESAGRDASLGGCHLEAEMAKIEGRVAMVSFRWPPRRATRGEEDT